VLVDKAVERVPGLGLLGKQLHAKRPRLVVEVTATWRPSLKIGWLYGRKYGTNFVF
jgi:hypothetical protein